MTAFVHQSHCEMTWDWIPEAERECDCGWQPLPSSATAADVVAWVLRHGDYLGAEVWGEHAPDSIAALVTAALEERGYLPGWPASESP